MATKKKFLNEIANPAMQFISTPEPEPVEISTAPEGYKANPLYIEKRSRRLQLLVQPSLYKRIQILADRNGTSINEVIHSILADAIKEN